MGAPEHIDSYSYRGCILTMLGIVVGVFACAVTLTLIFDNACAGAGRAWLPTYPEAQLVEENYSFLQMWGIGTSQRVLYTEDDILDVDRWYQRSDTQNSTENIGRGGASLQWRTSEAEDGGTVITLRSVCAQELDLSPFGIGGGGTQAATQP